MKKLVETKRKIFRVLGDLQAIVFESDLKIIKLVMKFPLQLKETWGDNFNFGNSEDA